MTYPIRTVAAVLLAAILVSGSGCTPEKLPPCQTEDSVDCVWVAPERGNHQGRSFWTDKDGGVHYVSHDEARKLVRR